MPRTEDPQVGLGRAVRQLREARGMSQEELAHLVDLHPTYISKIERAKTTLGWGNARKLAAALDVPLQELARLAEELEAKK